MQCLPSGFPANLEGPMAWDGAVFENSPELYTSVLNGEDLDALRQAILHFKGNRP